MDHSLQFMEWVEGLGFPNTRLGQLLIAVDQRFQVRRLLGVFIFSLALASLLLSEVDFIFNVRAGEVAATDIKSPVNLEFVDEVATEEKRREAEVAVPPVFDHDPRTFERTYESVYSAFLAMRRQVRLTDWPVQANRLEEAIKDFMVNQPAFEKELSRSVPARLFEWLIEKRFAARIENVMIRSLSQWSNLRLVDGVSKTLSEPVREVLVRTLRGGTEGAEFTVPRSELKEISVLTDFDIAQIRGAETLTEKDQKNVIELAQILVAPNLIYNLKETNERRAKAREAVLPIQRKVQKNQVIVAEGQIIQPFHMAVINEIEQINSARSNFLVLLATAGFFTLLIGVFLSYLKRFTVNSVLVVTQDLLTMGAVIILVTVIMKLFMVLTDQTVVARIGGGRIPQSAILALAPVAAGPMLVGLLITSGEVVWLFTMFLAASLSIMVDFNFGFLLVAVVGGIAAGRGVQGCKQRNDIYRAGLRVGLVNAAAIGLMVVVQKFSAPNLMAQLAWSIPAGFLAGLLSSVVTMGFVPLLETWFNYTTDIKLLELASLNHPLMKEMIVKAPGTYHHSLIVGSMCEAAAEEIGANPLLAKVMAYYHDIGKMEHAHYFIENQRPGHNPHDQISPHMSKTVLIAHVKDGAEMGYKHRLGQPIIDGILQHHGTTLINYFYNRAIEEQDETLHQVDEEEFRYPGPKPQFREAALVMLADSIEAAARSLDEPTTGRLQNIVKNVIQNKFLDSQLDECNLTLKDLTVIENSFKRILLGVYHQRIDYPMRPAVSKPLLRPAKGDRKGGTGA